MAQISLKAWLWKEFKKTFADLSLKTKVLFSVSVVVIISLYLIVGNNKENNMVPTKADLIEIVQNSKPIAKDNIGDYANVLLGAPKLVGVVGGSVDLKGIAVSTNPIRGTDRLAINITSYPGKYRMGKLFILQIKNDTAYLYSIPKNDYYAELQKLSYALSGSDI